MKYQLALIAVEDNGDYVDLFALINSPADLERTKKELEGDLKDVIADKQFFAMIKGLNRLASKIEKQGSLV